MIKLRNIIGKEFLLPVETEVTEKLSGDSNVSFEIVENVHNRDVVNAISKMWTVKNVAGDNDNMEYVIKILHKNAVGHKSSVKVTAVAKHINDLKRTRIYENLTGSFTAKEYFDKVFNGSGYTYRLDAKFLASRFENAGEGDTRLNMLNEGLKHYNAEFEYIPEDKMFVFDDFINHKANYYISDFVNASNFQLEEDATECYTYAKGFGNFNDGDKLSEAGLIVEARHPLADVLGLYEAPPIKDGRVKDEKEMRSKLEDVINNSIKTSLSLDFVNLQERFSEAVCKVGDYIPVKSNVIDINDMVRIVEVKTTRDVNNRIIKQPVTLGDYKKRDRYARSISNATSYVNNVTSNSPIGLTPESKADTATRLTTNVLDFANVLNASIKGLRSVNGLKVVEIAPRSGIRISNNGGSKYTDVITGDGINTDTIPLATSESKGLMSAEDKAKLDALISGNYVGDSSGDFGSIFYSALNGGSEPNEEPENTENIIGGIDSNFYMEVM